MTTMSATGQQGVTVYWRPGCPFCASLRSGLRRAGLAFREVNIWDDPKAAAFVRSVAHGNETVPTVSVGTVHLVNPSASKVLDLVAGETSGALASAARPPRTGRRWFFGRHHDESNRPRLCAPARPTSGSAQTPDRSV